MWVGIYKLIRQLFGHNAVCITAFGVGEHKSYPARFIIATLGEAAAYGKISR